MGLFSKIFGNNDITKPPIQPQMAPNSDGPGVMTIDDIFTIKGRGVVAVGRIESGTFRVGQPVTVDTVNGQISTAITGLEAFHKTMDFASAGENVGILLQGVDKDMLDRGDIIRG